MHCAIFGYGSVSTGMSNFIRKIERGSTLFDDSIPYIPQIQDQYMSAQILLHSIRFDSKLGTILK